MKVFVEAVFPISKPTISVSNLQRSISWIESSVLCIGRVPSAFQMVTLSFNFNKSRSQSGKSFQSVLKRVISNSLTINLLGYRLTLLFKSLLIIRQRSAQSSGFAKYENMTYSRVHIICTT